VPRANSDCDSGIWPIDSVRFESMKDGKGFRNRVPACDS
jgi:hypothetical protein